MALEELGQAESAEPEAGSMLSSPVEGAGRISRAAPNRTQSAEHRFTATGFSVGEAAVLAQAMLPRCPEF